MNGRELIGRPVVIVNGALPDPWVGERGLVTEYEATTHEVCVRPFGSPDTIVFEHETNVTPVDEYRLYDYETALAEEWRREMGLAPETRDEIIYSGKGVKIEQYWQRFGDGTEEEYYTVSMPLTRERTVFRATKAELLKLRKALNEALD